MVGLIQCAPCVRQAAEEYLHGVVDAATRGCEAQPVPDIATCLRKGALGAESAGALLGPSHRSALHHVELPALLGRGTSWSARVTRPCHFCLMEGALPVPPGRGSSNTRSFLANASRALACMMQLRVGKWAAT